jgi:hypothetical protein
MRISAPPAARPLLGSRAVRWPEELLEPERETTRRRMHASAPPAARPFLGSRAAGGPEELHDSERTYTSTHAHQPHLGTAGRGSRRDPQGGRGLRQPAGEPEELCDSEWPHWLCRDEVTV